VSARGFPAPASNGWEKSRSSNSHWPISPAWPPRLSAFAGLVRAAEVYDSLHAERSTFTQFRELAELEWAFYTGFRCAGRRSAFHCRPSVQFSAEDWVSFRVSLTPSARWLAIAVTTPWRLWSAPSLGICLPVATQQPGNSRLSWSARHNSYAVLRSLGSQKRLSALPVFRSRGGSDSRTSASHLRRNTMESSPPAGRNLA